MRGPLDGVAVTFRMPSGQTTTAIPVLDTPQHESVARFILGERYEGGLPFGCWLYRAGGQANGPIGVLLGHPAIFGWEVLHEPEEA